MEPVFKPVLECQKHKARRGNVNEYGDHSSLINHLMGVSFRSEDFGDIEQNE